MTISQTDLRELLHEHADVDIPVVAHRRDHIHTRIHRVRVRRRITGCVAVAGVVALATVAASLAGAGHTVPPTTTASASPSPSPIHASGPPQTEMVAADGTRYELIGTADLDTTKQKLLNVTLTTHGGAIAVMATCRTADPDDAAASIGIGDHSIEAPACSRTWYGPADLVGAPTNAGTVHVVIHHGMDQAGQFLDKPTQWGFAFYEWIGRTPMPAAPPTPKLSPTAVVSGEHLKLIAMRGGVWPAETTATFTIAPLNQEFFYVPLCNGAIDDAMGVIEVDYYLNGKAMAGVNCSPNSAGSVAWAGMDVPAGATSATITMKIKSSVPQYATRVSSWAIGIYAVIGGSQPTRTRPAQPAG